MQRSCWRGAPISLLCLVLLTACNKSGGTPSSFIDWRDPGLDNRISAYVPLIRAVNRGSKSRQAPIEPALARELAKPWAEAVDKGELQLLHPLYLDESPQDEPTYQISVAQRRLVFGLIRGAEASFESKKFKEAIENIELAFKIYKTTLRTDLITFTNQSLDIRKLLNLLVKYKDQLSDAEREQAVSAVEIIRPTGAEVAEFAKVNRRLAVEFQLRYDKPLPQEVPHEDIKRLEEMTPDNALITMTEVRAQLRENLGQQELQPLADLLIKQLSTELANQKRVNAFLYGVEDPVSPPKP